MARPSTSVVVPFFGDTGQAAATLRAVQRLELRTGDQVLVADNTPDGAFLAVAEPPVRGLSASEERASYYARNVGAEHANGDWLLFLDSDCRPSRMLLDDFFSKPVPDACGIVAGGVMAAPNQAALIARYARSRGHINEAFHARSGFKPAGITANLLVRRIAWEAVGGFQEGVRSGGDVEFCWRVQDAGWNLIHHPSAVVQHEHAESLGPMLRKTIRHAAGRAWLDRRYRGAAPRPRLGRPLARCGAGVVAWSAAGQFERALFKAIDAAWISADAVGYVAGDNRAERLPGGLQRSSVEHRPPTDAWTPSLVVLNDIFPALSETFVVNELRELRDAGHRVRVEASARPERPERFAAREFEISYLEDDPVTAKLAALTRLAARHPGRCGRDLIERRRWRHEEPVWGLRSIAPLARRLRVGEDDHLHVHFAGGSALHALRVSRLLGASYSVTAHAHDIYRDSRNLREKLERAAFATSGCDYTVSDLRALVAPEHASRIHKIIMGVDGKRFRRRSPYPGRGTVVAVGRLVEKKGFGYLVAAAGILRTEALVDRVQIVGDGPLRAKLQQQITALGVADSVVLLGWRDPEAIRDLLEDADLLVMPCVVAPDGDRDSMPVVVKEALAMEVPVVASDEVGLPELIRPEWGRLAPPHDSHALAEAIGALLTLPTSERREMGRAGREFVLEHCDVKKETAKLAGLILHSCGATQ